MINENVKLTKLIIDEELKADDGDVDAMFRCHQIYAIMDMEGHPQQLYYSDDSINWLIKADDNGHSQAIAALVLI